MQKPVFIPLADETCLVLSSVQAAPHLGLSAETLHVWANDPDAPIKPLRYNKRKLMWKTSDIKSLLGMAA